MAPLRTSGAYVLSSIAAADRPAGPIDRPVYRRGR